MHRVESKGSIWMLDDDHARYARMPKQEGPRWSPDGEDWGGPGAGPLEDLSWHPMLDWEIRDRWLGAYAVQHNLVIRIPGDDRVVVAPDAVVLA